MGKPCPVCRKNKEDWDPPCGLPDCPKGAFQQVRNEENLGEYWEHVCALSKSGTGWEALKHWCKHPGLRTSYLAVLSEAAEGQRNHPDQGKYGLVVQLLDRAEFRCTTVGGPFFNGGVWSCGFSLPRCQLLTDSVVALRKMVRTTVKRLSAPDEETKTLVLKYFGSDDDATCNTLLDRFVVLHAAVGSGTHTGKTFLLYEGDTSAAPSLDRDFAYVGHDGHVLGQDLEHHFVCVYLTDAFFLQEPLRRGCTILHELTHIVLGTDDQRYNGGWVYGRFDCFRHGARFEPPRVAGALNPMENADSLAYFAHDLRVLHDATDANEVAAIREQIQKFA